MLIWIVGIVSSLGVVGMIAAVIAVPGIAIPVLQKIVGATLKCKACMALLAAIALLFVGALYGAHVERARCESRIERDHRMAEAARQQRDQEVKADLEHTFKPQLAQLSRERDALQEKVKEYAKRKPVAGVDGKARAACKLGDAAGLLRPSSAR
jgi:uncharacterized membrane protein